MRDVPASQRPRERLLSLGAEALSDAELIAVILGTGSQKNGVLSLSHQISSSDWVSLHSSELRKMHGMGDAKAAKLLACLELARRTQKFSSPESVSVSSPEDVVRLFPEMPFLKKEVCMALLLNSRKKLLKRELVSIGSLTSNIASPAEIFKAALRESAAAIILAHNHPSGDSEPSASDVKSTGKISGAGKLLEIPLLDHVIIGRGNYFSFKGRGLL